MPGEGRDNIESRIAKFGDCLSVHELVGQGNKMVVTEHNLELIKTADWIIDLGPEGGDGGGEIVAVGGRRILWTSLGRIRRSF